MRPPAISYSLQREGPPHVYVLTVRQGVVIASDVLKPGRHDAYDSEQIAIEPHALADDLRVRGEAVLPKVMTEHHDATVGLLLFARLKIAAQGWLKPQQAEEPRRNLQRGQPLRAVALGELQVGAIENREVVEYLAVFAII